MKTVSIIIPVYNEKTTIEKILKLVEDSDTLSLKKEIIVVDDCSTDGTKNILAKYLKRDTYKVIEKKKNEGKGSCIKKGIAVSTGDIVIIQDADLEYTPADYPALLEPMVDGHADVVYGTRFVNANPHRVLYFYHYAANKFITMLSNMFTNLNLTDIETGYKVFNGNVLRAIGPALKSKKFGFEPEITARIAKVKGLRIYEVGISYYGRTYEEGKKIGWVDGIKAIYEIIRYSVFS